MFGHIVNGKVAVLFLLQAWWILSAITRLSLLTLLSMACNHAMLFYFFVFKAKSLCSITSFTHTHTQNISQPAASGSQPINNQQPPPPPLPPLPPPLMMTTTITTTTTTSYFLLLPTTSYSFLSGYTYMAVWVGGLEVWEIRVMCKIDLKNVFFFVCFVFVLFFV